jgi:hypothetical protein
MTYVYFGFALLCCTHEIIDVSRWCSLNHHLLVVGAIIIIVVAEEIKKSNILKLCDSLNSNNLVVCRDFFKFSSAQYNTAPIILFILESVMWININTHSLLPLHHVPSALASVYIWAMLIHLLIIFDYFGRIQRVGWYISMIFLAPPWTQKFHFSYERASIIFAERAIIIHRLSSCPFMVTFIFIAYISTYQARG